MESLAWSMKVLARDTRPTHRHDQPAGVADEQLNGLIAEHGANLGFRAVIIWIKGGWAENHSLGLPSVSVKHSPCIFCDCTSATMHQRYRSLDFGAREGDYEQLCSEREVIVFVDSEDLRSHQHRSWFFV
jgi:hypothetical protein